MLRSIVPLLTCALLVAGCGGSSSAGDDGRPLVLTSFTVIADMTRNVAGDRVEVASITKPGSEVHGYEPTPSDLTRAADADLILDNGLGLERWFEQFVDRAGTDHATLSDGVEPIPIAGDGEYAGQPNPHAWMSTDAAQIYVDNIRDALTELDPEGRDTYARNADAYRQRLARVGERIAAELADLPAGQRALVSCEGAFSYLARDLGLREAYLWPVNAEQEGTPRQVASVVRFVRDNDVPAVFCESTVSPEAQEQVAREAGTRFGGALYVDSLSAADGPVPSYEALLQRDADTIVAGLTGQAR